MWFLFASHPDLFRSTFLDVLVQRIDPHYTHFNKRCISVQQPSSDTDRPVVHFTDGTTVEADIVLIANGFRGAGREAVTGMEAKSNIAFSNVICYRGLVPMKELEVNGVTVDLSDRPACFMGMGQVLILPRSCHAYTYAYIASNHVSNQRRRDCK